MIYQLSRLEAEGFALRGHFERGDDAEAAAFNDTVEALSAASELGFKPEEIAPAQFGAGGDDDDDDDNVLSSGGFRSST